MRWVVLVVALALLCGGVVSLLAYGGYEYKRVADATVPVAGGAAQADAPAADAPPPAAPSCAEGKDAFTAKDYELTTTLLAVCLDAHPSDTEARLLLGRAYAATGRYERADSELEAALAQRPGDAAGWEALAYARVKAENDRGAASALDKWITLDAGARSAWRMRADVRYRMGDAEGAARDAAQACALGDEDGCTLQSRMKDVSRRR